MVTAAEMSVMIANLEDMVDAIGLRMVLIQLEEVCALKAEHISSNWQDQILARQWSKCAQHLSALADRKAILSVSPDSK